MLNLFKNITVKKIHTMGAENTENKKPQPEEIDLLDLFARMGNGLKNLMIWLYNLVVKVAIIIIGLFLFVAKKAIWIIIFGIAGAAFGYFVFSNTRRFYSSEMVACSNSIENKYIVASINLLDAPIRSGMDSYTVLATHLNVPEKDIRIIKSIRAGYGIDTDLDGIADYVDYEDKFDARDTTCAKLKGIFYTQIELFDDNYMEEMQNGLLNYINKNQYLIEMNKNRVSQLNQQIDAIEREIQKLDSLQHIMYFVTPKIKNTIPSDKLVFMNEIDQKLYHKDILELKNSKREIEKDLSVNGNAITIIQPFSTTASAMNPLTQYVYKWVFVFIIIGVIVATLWQYRKFLWGVLFNRQESQSAIYELDNLLKIKKENK